MNIIDFTTKTKNDICAKISKNVSDFPSITNKTISKCGPLTKEHLAEGLLTLIKYSFLNRTRFSIELVSQSNFQVERIPVNISKVQI